jgi:hypothetical protein
MKKMLFYAMSLLALASCDSSKKEKSISIPEPPTDLFYEVKSGAASNSDDQVLIGKWNGTLGGRKFELSITNKTADEVSGFNIVDKNNRPIKGKYKDEGDDYSLTLKEPGDDKYDGVFNFKINKKTKQISGDWKMYKGNAQYQYKLEKDAGSEINATNIEGPLSGYVEAVPGSYQIELKKRESSYGGSYDGSLKLKLKFLKSISVK